MFRSLALRCKTKTKGQVKWKINENNVEYKNLKIKWDDKNVDLQICDLLPSNRSNIELLELKNMNIIKDIKKTKFDCVIFGIGYVDYDKILKSFNRADLVQRKAIDSIHANLKKVNGQYISIIQQCLLLNIPHFCLGRDRLTELTSIGTAIFNNPKEILSLLYYFLVNSEQNDKSNIQSNNNLEIKKDEDEYNLQNNAPNFYNALVQENALYLIYNFHATLLRILRSKYYIPPYMTPSNINYTNIGNKGQNTAHLKKSVFSFFNETTYDIINNMRNTIRKSGLYSEFEIPQGKKDINILIICDSICVDYFYNYIKKNFNQWYNISPFYNELYTLEKKNTYKFVLALFLFIIAPVAWTLTFLIKYGYELWVEYFTKGKAITVGGNPFFKNSRLIDINEIDNNPEINDNFVNSINKKNIQFETVSALGGLMQWFKNKTRD
ncbi:conserved Plasmodium protein, unknown function [Plasmodium chabaudi chabaudi]|uniref:Uncharacterized protein n=1 Tax=Plasmodium chabaudi chabaudi TaxID=31271 RepID=A0A1C6XJB0_PLACU|nr:conserved Plasmodium protein, unknown function [Plasmodium chabaudi chabaudi]